MFLICKSRPKVWTKLKQDSIAEAIEKELKDTMEDYGYKIHKALVTNIDPDQKVKDAMNEDQFSAID